MYIVKQKLLGFNNPISKSAPKRHFSLYSKSASKVCAQVTKAAHKQGAKRRPCDREKCARHVDEVSNPRRI